MTEILRLEGLTKTFPGVLANDCIDLEIERGEVHALLGENGSGKTTLMNCVYGVYHPTNGRIFWKGQEVQIRQARDAIALGIGMVHQHFMLIPPLTVAENVILGLDQPREPFLDLRGAEQKVRASSERFHLEVDPKARVWELPVGAQQRVEILKALYRNAELLILDEPTAVLTPDEVEQLFRSIKTLTQHGLSVILITHKLEEVTAVCDRVTVLRDGRKIRTMPVSQTRPAELARMMVGREVLFTAEKPPLPLGDVMLSVENLSALNSRGLPALKNVSLAVREHEVLGIAGVDGNGQTELVDVIMGMRAATAGRVTVGGADVTNCPPAQILRKGVACVPPDRQRMGLFMDFTVAENLISRSLWESRISRRGFLRARSIAETTDGLIENYSIRAPDRDLQVKLLSGGNQQKVLLARELFSEPNLLIAAQPTRGLDIGAIEYVHRRIIEARSRAAVLLISTELSEVLTLSDRIAVLYGGEIMGVVPARGADINQIGEMMAGVLRLGDAPATAASEQSL